MPTATLPRYLEPFSTLAETETPRAATARWFAEARYGLFLHYGLYSLGRDLVGELAAACDKQGLGLFLYYSHGRDWRHPHAPNNDAWGGAARPQYDPPEPAYATGAAHDLNRYLDFMTRQITELLTQYPTVAGIWLDGIAVPLSGDPKHFRLPELYAHIHTLQPHVIFSYKQGVTGTEDYFAPEHGRPGKDDNAMKQGQVLNRPETTVEICTTMIEEPRSWGYFRGARHKDADGVWATLVQAAAARANLLLNTGPLADGSLDPADVAPLQAVGERLRREGFPPFAKG